MRITHIVVVSVMSWVVAIHALAQPSESEFDAMWAASERGDLPKGVFLGYSKWSKEAMQRNPGLDPVDTNKGVRLWYWDDTTWRIAGETKESSLAYADFGQSPNENGLWILSDRQMRLNESVPRTKSRFDPGFRLTSNAYAWVQLCHGITGSGPLGFTRTGPMTGTDSAWIAKFRSEDGTRSMIVSGTSEDGRYAVTQTMVRDAATGALLGGYRFAGWKASSLSDSGQMASTIERLDEAGEVADRVTLLDAHAVTRDEVLARAKRPELDGTDPIRGKVTATSFVDDRPGHDESVVQGENGWQQAPKPKSRRSGWSMLPVLGWIALVGMGVGLFWYRSRTR